MWLTTNDGAHCSRYWEMRQTPGRHGKRHLQELPASLVISSLNGEIHAPQRRW